MLFIYIVKAYNVLYTILICLHYIHENTLKCQISRLPIGLRLWQLISRSLLLLLLLTTCIEIHIIIKTP